MISIISQNNLSWPPSFARTAIESSKFFILYASSGYSFINIPSSKTCSATLRELKETLWSVLLLLVSNTWHTLWKISCKEVIPVLPSWTTLQRFYQQWLCCWGKEWKYLKLFSQCSKEDIPIQKHWSDLPGCPFGRFLLPSSSWYWHARSTCHIHWEAHLFHQL